MSKQQKIKQNTVNKNLLDSFTLTIILFTHYNIISIMYNKNIFFKKKFQTILPILF